jgi:hypothetical protein
MPVSIELNESSCYFVNHHLLVWWAVSSMMKGVKSGGFVRYFWWVFVAGGSDCVRVLVCPHLSLLIDD